MANPTTMTKKETEFCDNLWNLYNEETAQPTEDGFIRWFGSKFGSEENQKGKN